MKPEDVIKVKETVQKMMDLMKLDIDIQAEAADTGIQLAFEGDDKQVLTARNGELMGHMRFVLNRMGRRGWPDSGRVLTNTNSPKLKERDEELLELVREVIQQVSTSGESKRLHSMNAYERRLVHIEVRKNEGVGSQSDGDGDQKRVTIYPDPDNAFNEASDPETGDGVDGSDPTEMDD